MCNENIISGEITTFIPTTILLGTTTTLPSTTSKGESLLTYFNYKKMVAALYQNLSNSSSYVCVY